MNFRTNTFSIFIAIFTLGIFSWIIKPTLAVEYQNCPTNEDCVLGEFLFDDSYTPIATASCSITSRYPDGSVFINSATMSASSNGWYSLTASPADIEGIYPTQICCTIDSEYLCLDKSFIVAPAVSTGSAITASDVWTYSDRSLSSFGSLVADIWSYSSRSLSSFGNLVADVWSRDTRTLTSSSTTTGIISNADILEIKKVVKENRLLLEQLINKPIVKTFIDDSTPPVLSEKIEQTKTLAGNLYSSVQNLKSRSLILEEKWLTLSEEEIKSELATLIFIFKADSNQKDTNILSTTNWLKTSWNSPILLSLSEQAQLAQSQIENILNDINLYGKNKSADTLKPTLEHIQNLNDLVGTSLATADDISLFGFLKKTSDRIATLDNLTKSGLKILTDLKKNKNIDQSLAIANLSSDILLTNLVPQTENFFIKSIKNTNTPVNKVLGLLAIVDSNRLLLAGNTGQAIENIWLEEGSLIFRSVAINPSHSISQKVTVKYYLPTELRKEQVISHDPELTIDYDPVENALFASTEVTLAPQESRTFLVEVEDIWSFKQEEIDSLKNQVNELVNVLKNTALFAQATSIKSDIFVTLDKIMLRQDQAVTPENRIQTFRESALEMNGVEEKITSLKELVLQLNRPGGFFGGISSITLWGFVLVIIAGFAFLIFYFNALRSEAKNKKEDQKEAVTDALEEHDAIYHQTPKYRHRETHPHKGHHIARIASIALLATSLSSVGASFAVKASRGPEDILISPSPDAVVLGVTEDNTFPYETKLKTPDPGTKVPVRNSPAITSPEITSLKGDQKIIVFKVLDKWAQIGLTDKDETINWWVNIQYLDTK